MVVTREHIQTLREAFGEHFFCDMHYAIERMGVQILALPRGWHRPNSGYKAYSTPHWRLTIEFTTWTTYISDYYPDESEWTVLSAKLEGDFERFSSDLFKIKLDLP